MVADFWPCKMRSEKYLGALEFDEVHPAGPGEMVCSRVLPVTDLKRACQAKPPTQVEVLMMPYKVRLNDLNPEKPV
ncbi:uncharacterized protein PITG_02963 [Phytophthora infestans T30-4]|uniref:Uncharacterized protein n=1 Tax=Phytophthora infestans (strain T30-4) TaxID=403677 RepID=D0MXL5_PHYIT|nr:uncharacterized protein PITG_02963 [Phytophthora infestans T30-4]EEY64378.1 hypothetical protein PITG_02963 [Phytophthora infestans T30-4]|eukprot:XP_002907814.1 hypothetical protein PITG_02963 [Phytophthora infestans T30-4]